MDPIDYPGVAIFAHYPGPLTPDPDVRHLEAITGPPHKWVQLLRALHRERGSSDRTARAQLLIALRTADDPTWHTLWASGFVEAIPALVTDVYFCGYDKEELSHLQDSQEDTVVSGRSFDVD